MIVNKSESAKLTSFVLFFLRSCSDLPTFVLCNIAQVETKQDEKWQSRRWKN